MNGARALVLVAPLALLALGSPGAGVLGGCNWPPGGSDAGAGASSGGSPGHATAVSPAVIDAVDLSASASIQGNFYPLYGTITFHDDAGKVHLVRMRVPVIGKAYDYAVGDVSTEIGLPLPFVLSADLPLTAAGPTNLTFTLVDTDGAETSPPVLKTVDLQ